MTTNNNMSELEEDTALSVFAEEREQSFDEINALKHSEVWYRNQKG